MVCRYVDDIRLILSALAAGWRWDGKRISFKEEWKQKDELERESSTVITARVLKEIMNSIANNSSSQLRHMKTSPMPSFQL